MKRYYVIGIAVFLTIAALLLSIFLFVQKEEYKVAAGTSILIKDNVCEYIGDITIDQASDKVDLLSEDFLNGSLSLVTSSKTVNINIKDIGIDVDKPRFMSSISNSSYGNNIIKSISKHLSNKCIIDLRSYIEINDKRVEESLNNNLTFINTKAENASLFINSSGDMDIKKEIPGAVLDMQKLKIMVTDSIKKGETKIDVPVITITPKICEQDIKKIMPSSVVASFKSYYGGSDTGRKENIRLGASLINNILLKPGEEFEFWKYVGDTTISRGFKIAGVFSNGKVSTGIGGGLCQVSTALYNAALLADLQITERSPHSLPVSYVPLGLDATVSTGTYTLRFTNSTDGYILIKSKTDGETLSIDICSKPVDGKSVKIYSNIISYNTADSYRDIYMNGTLIKHEFLGRSKYKNN